HLNNEDLTPEEQALKEKQEAGDNEQSNEQTEKTSKDDDSKSK
ncbi:DivIVA domain-containing protein, partial [Staphylococcus aureus]